MAFSRETNYIDDNRTLMDKGASAIGKGIAKDIKSVGSAFNAGMDLGLGTVRPGMFAGGFRSSAKLGMIGAGIGALSTSFSEGTIDPIAGAGVGAAVGAFGAPVFGLMTGAIGNIATAGYKAATSDVSKELFKKAASGAVGTVAPYALGGAAVLGADIGSKFYNLGSKMIRWDDSAETLSKVKFTSPVSGFKLGRQAKLDSLSKVTDGKMRRFGNQALALKDGVMGSLVNGYTVLGGAAVLEGVAGAWNKVEREKMGANMGVVNMTPRVPSYSQNASATGDLVFALNQNRRG